MNYNPRYHSLMRSPLETIQEIEMIEDWVKERKKKVEEDLKKKSEDKKPHWLNDLTFPQVVLYTFTFGPWVGLIQYFMITEVLKRLAGH